MKLRPQLAEERIGDNGSLQQQPDWVADRMTDWANGAVAVDSSHCLFILGQLRAPLVALFLRYPIYSLNSCLLGVRVTGRTIPSWRIVLDEELARLARFKHFLRPEDRAVFDDLVGQCRLYASAAGVLASPVKEVPLFLSMIFAQHKRLMELEKNIRERTEG